MANKYSDWSLERTNKCINQFEEELNKINKKGIKLEDNLTFLYDNKRMLEDTNE
jgi:hypothetical protein